MYTSFFAACRWHAAFALLASTLVFASPAQADPAGRIGRISLLAGSVTLYNADSGESFAVPLNQPLTSGDILSTEAGSRAEIQIGSTTVRLDSGSRLELERIDDEQVSLYLADGRSIVKLSSAEAVSEFTLETRNGRFSPRRTGIYRFDTDVNSSTATAYYGSLHFASSDSTLDIGAGQNAQFWQDGQTRYRFLTPASDDFTRWSAARDQRPQAGTYSRYVSPEMTGAEDLDDYGDWSETPEFGAVWFPRAVAANWAPYRSGHWTWVAPWGWTWVGAEPWGFAPFHYGRWIQQRGAWGWVPGTRIARPVYAPAMVAWIGSPAAGVSISIGSRPTAGWFPLAPHEVYVPAFRSSASYIRKVNVTHVTRIGNVDRIAGNPQAAAQQAHYTHRQKPQSVTFVPADVVTHRHPVANDTVSPRDHRSLRERPVSATAPVSAPPPEARSRPDRLDFKTRPKRDPAAPVPQAAIVHRSERPLPEVARPAPPPREIARSSEAPRPEARTQPQQAERHQRRPPQDDKELRRRRGDAEKR